MDETSFSNKRMPDKTSAVRDEKTAAGFKMNKVFIKILTLNVAVCLNSTGNHKVKLPLLVMCQKSHAQI